jgi:transposase
MNQDNSLSRRRYSTEFKRQVMAECAEPGASVASVALSHGINANVVHKWRAKHVAGFEYPNKRPEFIAVPMGMAGAPTTASHVRIELSRGPLQASITWPVDSLRECAAMLRELLR